ncbi:hypothetical protein B0E38_07754 [Streptomyces sp. 111WW2]|uniref:hypothetical protein n=1 Tax=Streptomyces sp. 111WW2 TaxID=1945515 RepID=UPI000D0C7C7F|nr:hypothetical protein [Streptomyces sp. 111WW2]PSK43949.1 hypothetical protein B0E38_07754 [Streptomyces sp. 111WW2]
MRRHVYQCPRCGTESRPYALRGLAHAHADDHRRQHHGGDRPIGETFVTVPGTGWRDVPAEQRFATILLALIVVAVVILR